MRVEAVHGVAWLWANDAPSATLAAAEGTGRATETASVSLTSVLPILRKRAGRPTRVPTFETLITPCRDVYPVRTLYPPCTNPNSCTG